VILIAKQPDLGTALIVTAAGFYVIFLAGLSWKILVGLTAGITASLPLLWSVMHDYQRQRILTLLDPNEDPLGAGYHTIQATIAMGSGGFFGKGWLNGTQAHLDFLPERSGLHLRRFLEEFGLFGNLVLVSLSCVSGGASSSLSTPRPFTRPWPAPYADVLPTFVAGMARRPAGGASPAADEHSSSLVSILILMELMSIHTHKRLIKS
jgi:rod shape determining protein RodA